MKVFAIAAAVLLTSGAAHATCTKGNDWTEICTLELPPVRVPALSEYEDGTKIPIPRIPDADGVGPNHLPNPERCVIVSGPKNQLSVVGCASGNIRIMQNGDMLTVEVLR